MINILPIGIKRHSTFILMTAVIVITSLFLFPHKSWAAGRNNNQTKIIFNSISSVFNLEYILSPKLHPSPSGIRVYPDEGYLDCDDINLPPEIDLPFSDGGMIHGDQDRFFWVCSDGAYVHLTLFFDNVANQGSEEIRFDCYSIECNGFSNIRPPMINIWKSGSCYHNQESYEGNIYLPPGKYHVTFYLNGEGDCATREHQWSQFMDITAPRPSFDQTWSPENACLVSYKSPTIAHPVNADSGNFTHQALDISIPSIGGSLEFVRSYNALDLSTGILGRGWTHNFNMKLIIEGNQAIMIAPLGSRIHFSRNGDIYSSEPGVRASLIHNSDGSYTVKQGDQVAYNFDINGRLISTADSYGRLTTQSYIDDRLSSITAPNGREIELIYYNGLLQEIKDSAQNRVSYGYTTDSVGRYLLQTVTDTLSNTITYTYNLDGYLESIINVDNHIVTDNTFSLSGQVITQTSESLGTMSIFYSYSQTVVTDTDGNNTLYNYDTGILSSIIDPQNNSTNFSYDQNFNLSSIIDPLNHTTNISWNEDGCKPTVITDTLGNVTSMDYDDLNNLTRIVDANHFVTNYAYSGTLLITSTNPLGNTTYYTYTKSIEGVPSGLLKDVRDPLGNHTLYDYYQNGDFYSMTDGLGNVIIYTYDTLGQLLSTNYVYSGRTDWTCHDAAGRVWRTIANLSPNHSGEQCTNQFVPVSDPQYDQTHDTIYDARGNAIASIEWAIVDSQVVSYTTRTYYDDAGRPTDVVQNIIVPSIYDPTPPNYDQSNPDQNIRTRTIYNDDGTVKQTIDNAGNITQYCYDAMNRVVKTIDNPTVGDPCESYSPGSYPDEDVINETIYDANGNTIATIDPLGHVTRTYYDAINRPVIVVQNFTGNIQDPTPPVWNENNPDQNIRTDTSYDNNSNIQRIIDNSGRITQYCYDEANQLIKMVANLSNPNADPCDPSFIPSPDADKDITTRTVYDGNGNAIATIDPLGIITRTYYDDLNRPWLVIRNVAEIYIYNNVPPDCNRGYGDSYACNETVFDDTGNAIATIDPLGRVTRTYYDKLNRPVMVVRNLVGQGYENPEPPDPIYGNDENVAVQTFYDERGRAIATKEYWVEDGQSKSRITRTYYDDLGRQLSIVRNLVGQDISNPTPPQYNMAYPDQNVRVDTSYDAHGDAIITNEYLTNSVPRINRTYYDHLGRKVLIVRNLSPVIDPYSPIQPTCNRDSTGDISPFTICDETIYDRNGNPIAMTEPLGHTTRTYYDGLDRIATVVQNLQGSIQNPPPNRDPNFPDQNVRTDMIYDRAGNRSQVIDPNGIITDYEYDDVDRLTAVVENFQYGYIPTVDINVRTEYTYDKRGSQLKVRDANATLNNNQYFTVYTYDDLGRQITEADPEENVWSYQYDVQGNKVQMTDANGDITVYQLDGLDRVVLIDYPDPDTTTTYTYNALGWRVSMSDSAGTTNWVYDSLGRIISITDPFNSEIDYTYDASGNRTSIVYSDLNTKTVTYVYDSLGRLSQTIDWNDQTTSNKYNVAGNIVKIESPTGITSSYSYDGMLRLQHLDNTSSNGTISYFEYQYDSNGNRLYQTERVRQPGEPLDAIFADGFEHGDFSYWSEHTSSNDLTVETAAAIVETYGMRVNINDVEMLGVTDESPDSEAHYFARFYFDPNSISMSSGDAHQIFQGNDLDFIHPGPVIKIQFRKSGSLYYIDVYGRRDNGSYAIPLSATLSDMMHAIEIEWKASSGSGANNGYLKLWLDGVLKGTRSAIDNDTQRIDQIKLGTLSTPNLWTQGWYCFDAFASRRNGNLGLITGAHGCGDTGLMEDLILDQELAIPISVTLPYSGEVPISGTIPLREIIPMNGETTILNVTLPYTDEIPLSDTLHALGGLAVLPETLLVTNNVPIELSQAVLTVTLPVTQSIVLDEGETVVLTETTEITLTGVISNNLMGTMVDFYPLSPSPVLELVQSENGWSHEALIGYTYDPLYRLLKAKYNDGRKFEYTYDAVGNQLSKTIDLGSGNPVETNYKYDGSNRLQYVDQQAYTWDNNGNLLDDGVGVYTYTHANRLIGVSAPGITANFTYNGLGDRLQQSVNSTTQDYTLDLANGLTQVLSDGTNFYIYGNGRIAQYLDTTPSYYLGDALSSVRQLIDGSGNVELTKDYEPYGEIMNSAGTTSTAFGFTGEWTDYTGLVYLRARYYDPTIGRFISRDPSHFEQNLYLYASANPIVLSDPSGLMSGFEAFVRCFEIHTGSQFSLGALGGLDNISAQEAVDICKLAYSKDAWASRSFGETIDSALDLFGAYVNETTPTNHLVFDAQDTLTKEFTRSKSARYLRWQYLLYGQTVNPREFRFDWPEQFACATDNLTQISLTCFLGSFYYQIKTVNTNNIRYVGFRVDNRTDLGSGTHIARRYVDNNFEGSVENLILNGQITGNEPIMDVINGTGVISILRPLDRNKTGWYTSSLGSHELGGGNLTQTYVWMEKFDPCNIFSYLNFLFGMPQIKNWDNFYPPITIPIPQWEEPF